MSESRPAYDAGAPNVYRVVLRVERNGEVVGERDWLANEVAAVLGYGCPHFTYRADYWADEARCDWCQHEGGDGVFAEMMIVTCPHCDDDRPEADIVRHWLEECGT